MARNQWRAMQETLAGLTQALQNVVQAGNQAAAARNGAGDLHQNFRSLNPPRFSGSPDPDEAENLQEEIERIFQVMECTNREKVVLATFQFTKDARVWWKATSAHLPNVGELEWARFLEIFSGKYFSERVKEKKAVEFAALNRKGMSVVEYEAQCARLAVYAPHLGRVEELLVLEELWNAHTKLFFFPYSSAATSTNCPLEVDQRRRPCEHDGPIGHVLRSCHDSKPIAF
ncbi:hypothetical protein Taro_049053 [Colocasia esculenta]|uniref:Retrotransposon gag domain-containing protein n=1 Tax=Colocasia esculenta TaxID=4460 RepID=A0A843X9X0_COLES|nr:hypothetical protein [Colocasia esculenta]